MKEIIRWLKAKLFRSKPINPPSSPESPRPERTELDLPKDMQDLVDDTTISDNAEVGDADSMPSLSLDDNVSSDTDK